MAPQGRQLELRGNHDGRHACTPLGPRHADSVNHRIAHARAGGDDGGDLAGGDVLALPAEGVANAIDEIEKPLIVLAHQIAGAVPGIALGKDIAQYLLLRRLRIRVAFEAPAVPSPRPRQRADGLADFIGRAPQAVPGLVAHGSARFGVEFDEGHRHAMRQERRDPADGAGAPFAVVQGEAAFGRGVILQDLRNAEASLELLPHLRPQAVAAAQPERVARLLRLRRARQQIPAQLTDVLEERAALSHDVLPELARREALAQHHGSATHERRAARHHAADAVVHRQAVVHAIGGCGVHQAGKPVSPLHEAKMADVGRFGQPGRARGVDEECALLERGRRRLRLAQPICRHARGLEVKPRQTRFPRPVCPAGERARQARARSLERAAQSGPDQHAARGHDLDGVRQQLAGQVRVEKRHGDADAGEAEPDGHVVGAVPHQQAHDVPGGQTLREAPARVTTHRLRERAVGQRALAREQRRRRLEPLGQSVDEQRQDRCLAALDGSCRLERA